MKAVQLPLTGVLSLKRVALNVLVDDSGHAPAGVLPVPVPQEQAFGICTGRGVNNGILDL